MSFAPYRYFFHAVYAAGIASVTADFLTGQVGNATALATLGCGAAQVALDRSHPLRNDSVMADAKAKSGFAGLNHCLLEPINIPEAEQQRTCLYPYTLHLAGVYMAGLAKVGWDTTIGTGSGWTEAAALVCCAAYALLDHVIIRKEGLSQPTADTARPSRPACLSGQSITPPSAPER